jgi:hypothetical protein
MVRLVTLFLERNCDFGDPFLKCHLTERISLKHEETKVNLTEIKMSVF